MGPKTSENTRFDERTTNAERASRAAPRRTLARGAASTARPRANPFAAPDGGRALRTAVDLAVADEREALRTPETQAAVDLRDDLRGDPVEVVPAVVADAALIIAADRTARALAAQRVLKLHRAAQQPHRAAQRKAEPAQIAVEQHVAPRYLRTVVTKHVGVKRGQRVMRLGNGMTAVIAFARSQVGKRYVSGGMGPGGFDCSGFTKRAYALAGIRLPHSSGAQAARSRSVSRAHARPGDLVVGPGHVGIYMGRGMMIDAGNHRTGVVYRKVYNGLRVARIG
ncbi:C40 family peptidase [Actinoplanes solisilvae]|uniref:C40 family peptidase n=1 Tax=Actinoplanes solisilvae TaxID=2486853 RepID=UPI001F0C8975|nr:NlpC/P60 family protein [Actinoplanes solisilvae]